MRWPDHDERDPRTTERRAEHSRAGRGDGKIAPVLAPRTALALLLSCNACVVPPIVRPAGRAQIDPDSLPRGSREVEIALASGEVLRGVYVPGEPDAPVVLHLLGASCSATYGGWPHTSGQAHLGEPVLFDLHDLGLSSLMVDWRGVGRSDGRRGPSHLREDARAMWDEAVARAGGDPARVIVRGTSIGALAAAARIEDGARPGAVVLFAPVLAETVAKNWVRERWWTPVAFLASALMARPLDVSLLDALGAVRCPLLVHGSEGDDGGFVTAAEAKAIAAAVEVAGGEWNAWDRAHELCALLAKFLDDDELALYAERGLLVDAAEARARRVLEARGVAALPAAEHERLVMLLAVADLPWPNLALEAARSAVPTQQLLRWLPWLPRTGIAPRDDVDATAWRVLLDFADRDGELPARAAAELAPWLGGRACARSPESLAEFLWALLSGSDLDGFFARHADGGEDLGTRYLALELLRIDRELHEAEPALARRPLRLLRVLFAAAGVPARERGGALDVFDGSDWRRLGFQIGEAGEVGEHALALWDAWRAQRRRERIDEGRPTHALARRTARERRARLLRARLGLSPDGDDAPDGVEPAALAALARFGSLDLVDASEVALAMLRSGAIEPVPIAAWFELLAPERRTALARVPREVLGELVKAPSPAVAWRARDWIDCLHALRDGECRDLAALRALAHGGGALRPSHRAAVVRWQADFDQRMASAFPDALARRTAWLVQCLRALGHPARATDAGVEVFDAGAWRAL